ncbi:putative peptidoglycan-binding domain-containing protein [Leptolyngbyaceae cyanobacterium JSC-12]|nr:putative peptidoglycan-binding domain-containing protein [Leptolyngbyaceae cyanobacterium JSC-12]
MELLAFVHTAVNYEDPNPDPEVTLLDGKNLNISSSAGVALAGVAMAMAAVSASPDQAVAATSSIGHGSSGEEVSHIQKALGIEADGQFGAKTEAAVMDFQIRQGLKQIDGVVGKETATALGLDEKYQPVQLGYVDTYSGIGLNVRSGPGLDYRRIGGLSDGTVIETFGEVVDRYGYEWQRIDSGAWVATDYVNYYDDVSLSDDCYYDCYYDCYDNVSYYDDYYRPVSYSGGVVDTYSGIGLNIRYGPGLGYGVRTAVSDGTYLAGTGRVEYRDGYRWEEHPSGYWYASDYVY